MRIGSALLAPVSSFLRPTWLRWPVVTLRTYLVWVILVATVPLGGLTCWLMAQEISASRQQLSSGLQRAAGSLALLVEREQLSSIDSLTILANSDLLKGGDLAGFQKLISRLPNIRPYWSQIYLLDNQGHVLLSNDRPYDASQQTTPTIENLKDVLSRKVPHVTGLMPNGLTPGWITRIDVPVLDRDEVRYVLSAEVSAQAWQSLLSNAPASQNGFVSLFDANNRIIARSMNPDRYIGQQLPTKSQQGIGNKPSGFIRAPMMESADGYIAWQRVGQSGWGIGVGVVAAPLDHDNLIAISSTIGIGALSLLAGLVLSFAVVRQVNRPLNAMALKGAGAVEGDISVREIAQLRDAMSAAEQRQKLTRERLETQAAEFETLFNTCPIGLSITQDPDCKQILRSPAKLQMLKWQPGQPVNYQLVQNGRVLPESEHPLHRAARGDTVWNEEIEVHRHDGTVLHLLAHAVPLLDAQGHPRGAIGTLVDITERIQAQARLLHAQNRLQESQHLVELAQEAGDVGFFDYVPGSDLVNITAGLARLMGWKRHAVEISWQEWLKKINSEDASVLQQQLNAAWHEGAESLSFQFRTLAMSDRDARWLSSRMVLMYGTDGRPIRIVGVMVDVTAQQLVEQERARLIEQEKKARLEAENANHAKDEFLAMLGHELRNPLSAISAAIEVLNRTSGQDEPAVRARMIINRQTRHLARLMDDLMDVARVIAGKIQLSRQPINLGATVSRLVNSMKVTGLLQDHPLDVDVSDVWIEADSMRLEQIVNNLVTNAVKYSPSHNPIKVSVKRQGDRARLQISDQGVGIPESLLPRIFDLFVQGERTLDRRQGGLGVGLTLVKSLVELHQGEISVNSNSEGSTFTVDLPLTEAENNSSAAVNSNPSTAKQVVIVEDNPDAREALRCMLELKGHQVWAEENGLAGRDRILSVKPYLALVDIGLPELSGFDVAKQTRAQGFDGWMIALSGYGQQRDVEEALACGFDSHMVKPLDETRLEKFLNQTRRLSSAQPLNA